MNTDPLAALKPIIEPTAISWFPPALGWWLVLGLVMLVCVATVVYFSKRERYAAYRREAKKLLKQHAKHDTQQQFAAVANSILKRTALVAYGNHMVGTLSGEAWLTFLDRTANMQIFTAATGRLMLEYAYGKPDIAQPLPNKQLLKACLTWVATHKAVNHDLLKQAIASTAKPSH